jgi:hypothetical protein
LIPSTAIKKEIKRRRERRGGGEDRKDRLYKILSPRSIYWGLVGEKAQF